MLGSASTVFVVGPDASVRNSLGTAIRRGGLSPLAFAGAEDFLACPVLHRPSCLVFTAGAFRIDTLDLLRRIAGARRAMSIVVVAAETDISTTVQAMKAGIAELLIWPVADDVLFAALASAIARSQMTVAREAEALAVRSRYDSLSHRERDVLVRVVAGQLNKWIGSALGISEITVKAHRGRVMRKMEAGSLAQLVTMAMKLELPAYPGARGTSC